MYGYDRPCDTLEKLGEKEVTFLGEKEVRLEKTVSTTLVYIA
jgi:hypothetical protein